MGTIGGGSDDTTVQGKYLLIEVPDFDPNSSTDNRTSYIRLGKPNTEWQNERGAELALMAYLAGAAGRETDNTLKAKLSNGSTVDIVNVVKAKNPAQLPASEVDDYAVNHPFIDDARYRGTGNDSPVGPPGHGLPPTTSSGQSRQSISSDLHAKCGWRDHCDGNRITTTYGDKVEVVWGNYKMIVMGRQWDPGQAMGWEASGNNVQDYAGATMPGASVTVEWIATAYVPEGTLPMTFEYVPDPSKPNEKETAEVTGGAWLLQNSTENVWQYSRNAGNFKEENWGDLWETYVGSENPIRISKSLTDGMQGHPTTHTQAELPAGTTRRPETNVPVPKVPSVGLPRGNPHILEKTWAIKIESYTGSSAWRIPSIHEETWAVTTNDVTNVSGNTSSSTTVGGNSTETTNVTGELKSTTDAGNIVDTTKASGGIVSTTSAGGAIVDITSAIGTIVSGTHSITNFEETVAGAHVEFHGSLLHADLEIGGVIEFFMGGKLSIDIAGTKELKVQKDEINLRELKTALNKLDVAMKRDVYALEDKNVALETAVTALIVRVGL
ncbi:MAG: hypothetical protein HUU21_21820 [Polyangiaceae bacterium]|nr:hypothetical protein [Polyangiaceae bacterium]NUQ76186.1 hypothetical protein [Polyangiaceae bacterium]